MNWKSFSWIWLPLGWMALIFWCSSQSVLPGPRVYLYDFLLKKLAHLAVYAVLFWCWWRLFQANGLIRHRWAWVAILALCLAYAVFDEWHQGWTPGRMMSARDVGLDFLASCLACLWSARLL